MSTLRAHSGNPHRAKAHSTSKVQFVWLVWALCWPWRGWKRWASARCGCICTSTGTKRQHRCDCLWRIHLKFRQTTVFKVWIRSSGKIRECLFDSWYQRTTEQCHYRSKKKHVLRKYNPYSSDHVAQVCSGMVRLEQCRCRAARERGGGAVMLWHSMDHLGQVWVCLKKKEKPRAMTSKKFCWLNC